MRTCATCRAEKPRGEYPSPQARRCTACLREAAEASKCGVCRKPLPLDAKGQPRKTCGEAECVRKRLARSGRKGARVKTQRARQRKRRRCTHCGVLKAKTTENFSPASRDRQTGEVSRLSHVCKPCAAALKRDRYRSDPQAREKALARARERRERILDRIASDEEFAVSWIERRRGYERDRQARQKLAPSEPERVTLKGGPRLPGPPLARAVVREAERRGVDLDVLAEVIGTHGRRVRAWQAGENVELVAADAALVELDVLWWDVWDPEEHPVAAAAFEGDMATAA